MGSIQGVIFLFFGAGFLGVAWNGLRVGELPAGAKGLSTYRPTRERNPGGFWFHFLLYVAVGCVLLAHGLLSLADVVEPLPLRAET